MDLLAISPWRLKNRISVELANGGRFQPFEYPEGALRDYKVIQFENKLASGRMCFGLGVGKDFASASVRAFFEFLERKAFFEKGIPLGFETTNGFATHKFKFLAKRSAISELIERDAFLAHWYSSTPFQPLSQRETSFLNSKTQQLKKLGYETLFVRTNLGFETTYASFLINRKSTGFAIGTSSGKSTPDDIEKSFVEACTNLFLISEDESSARERINQNGVRTLQDHRSFWLYLQPLPQWVLSNCRTPKTTSDDYRRKIEIVEVDTTDYTTVAARSEEFIDLAQGPATTEDLLRVQRRVRILLDSDFNTNQTLIHPIP